MNCTRFMLLGLSKLSTFVSMFGSIAVYWSIQGGPLAVGMASSIYVHEIGVVLWATGVRVLWIVGAVAMYQTIRGEAGPGHRPTLVTFAGLVLALAWFARAVG